MTSDLPLHRRGGSQRRALFTVVCLWSAWILIFAGGNRLRAAENARWNFLVTNLDVFPGTEQLFEPDEKLFWRLRKNLKKVKASEKLPGVEYPFTVSTDSEGRRRVPGPNDAKTTVFLSETRAHSASQSTTMRLSRRAHRSGLRESMTLPSAP